MDCKFESHFSSNIQMSQMAYKSNFILSFSFPRFLKLVSHKLIRVFQFLNETKIVMIPFEQEKIDNLTFFVSRLKVKIHKKRGNSFKFQKKNVNKFFVRPKPKKFQCL